MRTRSKGFVMGVFVVFCWLLFASIYSALKYEVTSAYSGIVAEGMGGGEEYEIESVYDLEGTNGINSYGFLKVVDDNYELVKDARDAADVAYDLCKELKMERCL